MHPLSVSEIFDMYCPYYILYGMTWEQYWYGDPWALKAYKDAYNLKRRTANEEMWLQGAYTYHAFATVLGNAFAKKGSKPRKYLEKPLDIFPKTEAEMEAEARKEREKIIKALTKWEKDWNKRKGEG